MTGRYFISYSRSDGEVQALKLAGDLAAGPPSFPVWLDKRDLRAGPDYDDQIDDELKACAGLLFVMTEDSVSSRSECKREWTRALTCKKPVIPLLFDRTAVVPLRLESRQYVDFTGSYPAALARLRNDLVWRSAPEGVLQTLRERLEDARRDLRRAAPDQKPRIEGDIAQLERQIAEQQRIIEDPQGARQRTDERISSGLERERAPKEPVRPVTHTRFINPPPMVAPVWFQDRHVETRVIGDCLRDDTVRMITVVGRGGSARRPWSAGC